MRQSCIFCYPLEFSQLNFLLSLSPDIHFSWLGPELLVCCLAHKGSTSVFLLLQIFSDVVWRPGLSIAGQLVSSPESLGSQGELIVYPYSSFRPSSVRQQFQRSSPQNPLGQSQIVIIIDDSFSTFYHRHYELISKFNVGLKTLLCEGLSEPECHGDLVYKKKLIRRNDFSFQFRKIITRYRRIGYNLNVMRQPACLVFYPIMVGNYAAFFSCTPVGRASDSMMAPT